MMRNGQEVNFDGLVGPTHNYSGLAYGNVASMSNQKKPSNPRQAALQGLEKMKLLMDLGIHQAVLPPQERPFLPALRLLGFLGSDQEVLEKAFKNAPEVFFACSSSSSMWTANAAIVTPSFDSPGDSQDQRVHFTPANLSSKFHRCIETATTTLVLKKIFFDEHHFIHHPPLPSGDTFADEGAANHSRFCQEYDGKGVHLFVYGRYALRPNSVMPRKYPARETYEAVETIARIHQLDQANVVFAQQNPVAIDAGVFHNDVISTGNQSLFLYHEEAFLEGKRVIEELKKKSALQGITLQVICVESCKISLKEAVDSYLFNSQIVTTPRGTMWLLAPQECFERVAVRDFLEELKQDPSNPIEEVRYIDLHQSMSNGGGPACLRLRVVLNRKELRAMYPKVLLNDLLYYKLVDWVKRHYRDSLVPEDLSDFALLEESRRALDELTTILGLGSIYSFQF